MGLNINVNVSKWQIFKYFCPYIVPYKKIVLWNLFTVVSICILGIISPLIIREIFDEVFPTKNTTLFLLLVVIGFLIEAIREVLNYIKGYIDLYVAQKIQHDLRSEIFDKFESLKIDYYTSLSVGDHLWRLTNDVSKIQDMVASNIPRIIQTSLEFLLLLGMAFWIDWKLSFLALLIIPVFVLNGIISFEKIKIFNKSSQESEAEVNGFLKENIVGIEEVKANNAQKRERLKYLRKVSNKIRVESKGKTLYLTFNLVNEQFIRIWTWLITAVAGYQVITGNLTMGDYLAVTIYLIRVFTPLYAFTSIYQETIWQLISGERLLHFLGLPTERSADGTSNYVENPILSGDISFKDITFKYKEYLPEVIRNLDLTIKKGQKVALVGPVGCGKTTLIKLLLKFYRPVNGNIMVNSVNISQIESKFLRDKIGVVLQRSMIFNDTIMNNIKYGSKKASEKDVINVLKLIGVYDYFLELDSGLNRLAGEDGCNLSGGQKQLIAIARAYIKNPEILIFDEATSSLDTFMEMKVNAALKKLMEGRTVIMIAHRLSSIKSVDRIIFMRDGKILEDGTLEDLLALKGYYYQIHSQHYSFAAEEARRESGVGDKGIGNGFLKIWDFNEKEAINYFQGNVRLTNLYDHDGELEIDLTGYIGYCSKVCVGKLPAVFTGRVLKQISMDIYVPEKTIKNMKNYFLLHLFLSNEKSEFMEVDRKKLNKGWNNIVLGVGETELKFGTGIKEIYFSFNSDEVINGRVYISQIKGRF